MGRLLTRLVDLRPGERVPLLQVFSALFCLIAAHTMIETARDALFLGKIPANRLTFVYAVLAGLAFVTSPWSRRFADNFGRRNALVIALMASSFGTTIFYLLEKTHPVVFGLYIWSGLLGAVLVSQFWLLAGTIFTVAQGKRLFGPLAAGGALGAVIGASFAATVLVLIPVDGLLLTASGLLLVAAIVLTTIDSHEDRPPATKPKALADDEKGGMSLLRDQPYLWRLAALIVLATAAVLVTDYLFKSVAAAHFADHPERLGPFFAQYYAVLNAIALVIQLFVAGYLIRRVGVVMSVVVLPLLLMLGGIGSIVASGAIWAVLATKGADGALRHSLNRVASELLWLPLPEDVRNSAKYFFDTVLGRLVQAATASVILGLAFFELDTPIVLSAAVVALSAGWIFVAGTMRRPYLDLFRTTLSSGTQDAAELSLDLNSVEVAIEALASVDDARVISAIELLEASGRAGLIPPLILYHQSEEVLVRSLEVISDPTRGGWVPLAQRLLTHKSEVVRVAAVRAIAPVMHNSDRHFIEERLLDISPAVRAHAVYCLARESADPPNDPRVRDLLAIPGQAGLSAKAALLDAVRDRKDDRWGDLILAMTESDDPKAIEIAAAAMSAVPDPRYITPLVRRLANRNGRAAIRAAIVSLGEPALNALERAIKDPATDPRLRIHVPRTLSRFDSQHAANLLLDLVVDSPSGRLRYKALRGLGKMVLESPVRVDRDRIEAQVKRNLVQHLRIISQARVLESGEAEVPVNARGSGRLLLGLLHDQRKQSLERAFRLLQIRHRHEDIRSVFFALDADDRKVRAHAQEFLDALTLGSSALDGATNRTLLGLIADDLDDDERVARAAAFVPPPPTSYREAVTQLLDDEDDAVVAIAAYHALELDEAGLSDAVARARLAHPAVGSRGGRPASEVQHGH